MVKKHHIHNMQRYIKKPIIRPAYIPEEYWYADNIINEQNQLYKIHEENVEDKPNFITDNIYKKGFLFNRHKSCMINIHDLENFYHDKINGTIIQIKSEEEL